ncbi:hypothetical protein RhiirA4_465629 [Rhizophagus irregularis]|uniref:Uncharacterized protein n=1 Tax=Rhizophagus irregularis TaxID=588596 RepID=A0A2I1GSF0_9GLOM|nr:hypothetical protein RhiirA4_465629 [Rhizophagus irregularis]
MSYEIDWYLTMEFINNRNDYRKWEICHKDIEQECWEEEQGVAREPPLFHERLCDKCVIIIEVGLSQVELSKPVTFFSLYKIFLNGRFYEVSVIVLWFDFYPWFVKVFMVDVFKVECCYDEHVPTLMQATEKQQTSAYRIIMVSEETDSTAAGVFVRYGSSTLMAVPAWCFKSFRVDEYWTNGEGQD